MQKKITVGKMSDRTPVYIEVSLNDGRLSVVGNIPRDAAGQCQDSIRAYMNMDAITYADGWDREALWHQEWFPTRFRRETQDRKYSK